ncbi:hypothetical protein TNCV_4204891 [Trichonephila clavipes]|nr:hypothetical protein TNCV_4204891 [Trichonephila clavipes]
MAKPCPYPFLTVTNPGHGGSIGVDNGKTLQTAKTKKEKENKSPISAILSHVGTPVVWVPRIIDTDETAVATLLLLTLALLQHEDCEPRKL